MTGLQRRAGRYYLRRRVPLDLVAAYGRSEITCALRTADPAEARRLLPLEWIRLDQEFAAFRAGTAPEPTPVPLPAPVETVQRAAKPARPPRSAPKKPEAKAGTVLDAVAHKWKAERNPDAKTFAAHVSVASWFHDRMGVIPVENLTAADVRAFKDKLLAEGCTHANIKTKLSRLRTLLNYAKSEGIVAVNPADGVRIIDPDAERRKRKPFDRQALASIFASPVYAQDERPAGGKGEAAYWLPLLALFTGARLNELGQLRPSDVFREKYLGEDDAEQSAWVMRLTEDQAEGLRLKNAGSERIVPVHPALEAQGFIRFVQAAAASGHNRLFPALKPNTYGIVTAKFSDWFGRYLREACRVTDPRLVFHSFRHSFKHYARHAGVIEGVQRQIMGHSGKDVADDYGDGYSLYQVVEGMRRYRVPGLEMPALPPALREPCTAAASAAWAGTAKPGQNGSFSVSA